MSYTNVHVDRDDDIRPATSQIPGYVQVHLGDVGLMMRTAKARELRAALDQAIAAAPTDQDGA